MDAVLRNYGGRPKDLQYVVDTFFQSLGMTSDKVRVCLCVVPSLFASLAPILDRLERCSPPFRIGLLRSRMRWRAYRICFKQQCGLIPLWLLKLVPIDVS